VLVTIGDLAGVLVAVGETEGHGRGGNLPCGP
jgi:hypothetical protein